MSSAVQPTLAVPSGWASGPFAVLDLETTGVDPATARIVELALLVDDASGGQRELYAGLVDPGAEVEIPPGAAAVHGITRERLEAAQAPPAEEILPAVHVHLHTILAEGWPLVIYNATYDWPLLAAELRRLAPPLELPELVLLDPLVLDRHVDRYRRGKRTLETACQVYGVTLTDAHSARADAIASVAVARALVTRYPELAATPFEDLATLQVEAHARWRDSFNDYLQRVDATRPLVRETWPGLERIG
ncbi:MAG: exonuclease domain-containing protein [Nitriliruptoraceae bacterium]